MENLNEVKVGVIYAGTLRKGLGYGTRSMGQNWMDFFGVDNCPEDMDAVPAEQAKKFLENLLGPKQGRRETIRAAAKSLLDSYFSDSTVTETFPAITTQKAPAKKREHSGDATPAPAKGFFSRFMDKLGKITIAQVRTFLFDLFLFLIIFVHAVLIWYDCCESWGTPGNIAGGMVFLLVAATFIVATDPSKNVTSEYAVGFDALLCIGSIFVHYPTFMKYSTINSMVTTCLSVVIPLVSWVALALYRHSKTAIPTL